MSSEASSIASREKRAHSKSGIPAPQSAAQDISRKANDR
jgi:hypothetical protein